MHTIRYVILNFQFPHQRDIPTAFHALMESEDKEMLAARGPAPKGVQVLETNGYRTISTLVHDIASRGFRLSRVRTFAKDSGFLVRCSFATEGAVASPAILAALNTLCSTTLWRARAYRNPALREGVVIPELSDINVALAFPSKIGRTHRASLSLDTSFF